MLWSLVSRRGDPLSRLAKRRGLRTRHEERTIVQLSTSVKQDVAMGVGLDRLLTTDTSCLKTCNMQNKLLVRRVLIRNSSCRPKVREGLTG